VEIHCAVEDRCRVIPDCYSWRWWWHVLIWMYLCNYADQLWWNVLAVLVIVSGRIVSKLISMRYGACCRRVPQTRRWLA